MSPKIPSVAPINGGPKKKLPLWIKNRDSKIAKWNLKVYLDQAHIKKMAKQI